MVATSISTIAMSAWPLEELIDCLGRLEVDQVTLSARQLDQHGWAEAEAALRDFPVRIGAVGSGFTTAASAPASELGEAELDRLGRTIELAARQGIPLVALTTGPAGRLSWEDALEAFADRTASAFARARELGVGLTLENTHSLRSEVSFLHTLRDAVVAARQLGVGVCADLYCCWAERGLAATLAEHHDVIEVVQYADFVQGTMSQPNRWVPGDADLPLDRLYDEVVASGYTGVHEIEILGPAITAAGIEAAHVRALEWLRSRND